MISHRLRASQSGQLTLEAVLLIAILVGGSLKVWRTINEQQWAKQLVEGPWRPLKAMIEDGEWRAESKNYHPNLLNRHGTRLGDEGQD